MLFFMGKSMPNDAGTKDGCANLLCDMKFDAIEG